MANEPASHYTLAIVSGSLCFAVPLSLPCIAFSLQDFSPVPKLSTNDYLRLASTFHSLHAITARGIHVLPAVQKDRKGAAGAAAAAALAASQAPDALPRNQEGIQSIEARDFRLHCFQTLTGIKFLLVASPNFSATTLDKVLQGVSVVAARPALGPSISVRAYVIELESNRPVAHGLALVRCMSGVDLFCRYLNYSDYGQPTRAASGLQALLTRVALVASRRSASDVGRQTMLTVCLPLWVLPLCLCSVEESFLRAGDAHSH
jgi:hypothetical protein